MIITPRQYQIDAKHQTYRAWAAGLKNICVTMPTGAGKTVFFSDILHEHKGAAMAIAHRQELVGQMSLALALLGVYHNIIASRSLVKFIAKFHIQELGKSFFHPQAPINVAGVDTLIRRDLGSFAAQVTLWVLDECHHLLRSNKWGKAVSMFPNARGLGVTATPGRADGRGLGAHAQGAFHALIEGPTMRELINTGYLTDYRIFAPSSDMDLSNIDVSKTTGDFNPNQLRQASHKSHIVGDVVDQYLKIAPGKLGLTFAVDVETATEIAARYNAAGVPAAVVSAKTPDPLRVELMNRFKRQEIKNLVNVDIYGEGTDVPACSVVSMARPTQSYGLYAQQFGRGLRPMDGKTHAIIIDHVGNVVRHGLPDAPRTWTLNARERGTRGKQDGIPLTACTSCMGVYERIYAACPYCGHKPEPMGRAKPEQVDGDLFELTPEALAQLRGEVQETPEAMKARLTAGGLTPIIVNSQLKIKREQQEAIAALSESINWWRAYQNGDSESESYRRFYHRFGVDVLTAQTLGRRESMELMERIRDDYEG